MFIVSHLKFCILVPLLNLCEMKYPFLEMLYEHLHVDICKRTLLLADEWKQCTLSGPFGLDSLISPALY